MSINIGSVDERERSTAEVADQIRGILRNYPQIRKGIVTEGGGMMGGASSIKIEVYGYDFEKTDAVEDSRKRRVLAGYIVP